MAHAHGSGGAIGAARAGAASIEHGVYLDDEAIGVMREHGTTLVPTLLASAALLETPDDRAIPERDLQRRRAIVDGHRDAVRRTIAAGVPIVFGTDSGVTAHGRNLEELALMEACGMSPVDVLRSATSDAAALIGLGDEIGTIASGRIADLVVIEGPAEPLASLPRRVRAVIQRGRLVSGSWPSPTP